MPVWMEQVLVEPRYDNQSPAVPARYHSMTDDINYLRSCAKTEEHLGDEWKSHIVVLPREDVTSNE